MFVVYCAGRCYGCNSLLPAEELKNQLCQSSSCRVQWILIERGMLFALDSLLLLHLYSQVWLVLNQDDSPSVLQLCSVDSECLLILRILKV